MRIRFSNIILTLLLVAILSHFWGGSAPAQGSTTPISKKIVQANTEFGLMLFSKLREQDEKKNTFISPASISIALAMTLNGAQSATRGSMARTLGWEGLEMNELNSSYANLIASLNSSDSNILLSVANSLWARKGVPFKDDFVATVKSNYGAEVTNLDFSDPASPAIINGWVNQHTRGKIRAIVDKLRTDLVLLLINAIYFKGNWSTTFNEKFTRPRNFHLLGSATKQVPMMWQSGAYRYLRGSNFQAICLPYGNHRIGMYVFLPDSEVGIQSMLQNLTGQRWDGWISQFQQMGGDIAIPRFKLENDFVLNEALKSMGMESSFDVKRADLHGMISLKDGQNAFISEVRHKTFVEVNEKGTEAAAVTSVGVMITDALQAPEQRFHMVVDRPFLCAIVDQQSKMLLFFGAIVDP